MQWFELTPKVGAANRIAREATGFEKLGMRRTKKQQEQAIQRFEKTRREYGYNDLRKPGVIVRRARYGSVFQANIAAEIPPGTLWKITWPRGTACAAMRTNKKPRPVDWCR